MLALIQLTVQPAALRLSAMIFQYFLLIIGFAAGMGRKSY
jgi:hypothetical protein